MAGLGQALQEERPLPYHQARNEQAMVHVAVGLRAPAQPPGHLACTTSIGPGATNMVTGAALATINRLPVLLLPGDTFATRAPHPVLQQLEVPHDATLSVNDCFSRCRATSTASAARAAVPAALEAMRVLTDQAETGAVTLALPEDVQAEAFEFPEAFLEKRVWTSAASRRRRRRWRGRRSSIRGARRPLIVAGGGMIYSEATEALRALAEATGIPVGETQAGSGALPFDHPAALGAVGATGTCAANRLAREADLVIGDRHPLERLHHRLALGVPAPRRAVREPQHRAPSTPPSTPGWRSWPMPGRRSRRCATRSTATAWTRTGSAGAAEQAGSGRRGRAPVSLRDGPLPQPAEVIGAVNDAAGDARRGGVRGRLDARRPAQALARARPARATTSSTATRAWATRSPAAWA